MIITNALSLNMLDESILSGTIIFDKVTVEDARRYLADGFVSAIGHETTAAVVSSILGMDVPPNRMTVNLRLGDRALVAQYRGRRLPEGTTVLPQGAKVEFYLVGVLP